MIELPDLDFDNIMKEFFLKHKNFNEGGFSVFWKDYKKSPIVEDIKLIVDIYRERIKSLCELYLKYKDKPNLFAEEQFPIDWKYDRLTGTYITILKDENIEYNHWLFKEVFGSIFSTKEAEELKRN